MWKCNVVASKVLLCVAKPVNNSMRWKATTLGLAEKFTKNIAKVKGRVKNKLTVKSEE